MSNITKEALVKAGYQIEELLNIGNVLYQKRTRDKTINLVHTNMNGWECEILWYKGVFGSYEGKFSFDVGRKSLEVVESIQCPFTQEDELKAANHNAAEKKAEKKYPGKQVSVAYTEV
jgi:hypothetical protein